jgi:hypothetical protein
MGSETRRYPWRTFIFLVAAGTLTGPLVIPYLLGLEAIAPGSHPPESLRSLILSGLYQNLMFLVPGTAIGLLLAPKLRLGAPYLETTVCPGQLNRFRRSFGPHSSGPR